MSDVPKLLLVTGAGASRNLSAFPDEPMPLMADWAERLRQSLGPELSSMSGLDGAQTGPEFEETLGSLLRWQETFDTTRRFARMTKPSPAHDEGIPNAVLQGMDHATGNLNVFTDRLHTSLFDEFGPERLNPEACAAAYEALFVAMGDPNGTPPDDLVIATTNYDRSLEIAFERMGITPRTGFHPHRFLTPQLTPMGLGEFRAGDPSIIYLHGAVGWYLTDTGAIMSTAADRGYNSTMGRPAVLYPDPKKQIERAETAALWAEFLDACKEATHILVLGHSLNDEHLVKALRDASHHARVAYVMYRGSEDAKSIVDDAIKAVRRQLGNGTVLVSGEFGPAPVLDASAVTAWFRA